MEGQDRRVGLVVAIAVILALWCMFTGENGSDKIEVSFDDVAIPKAMQTHSKEFSKREIIKVTEGVYVAVGYALANVVFLEGPVGVVVVDVTESVEAATEIYRDFQNITKKPIKGIIYTHSHVDHILGTKAFLQDVNEDHEIWAHHTLLSQHQQSSTIAGEIVYRRAMRQFGYFLDKDLENAGIGPFLRIDKSFFPDFVPPNRYLFENKQNITIAGLDIQLIHIPGETNNQIGVWLPSKGVLLCADDLYKAFPNLYAIRGTPTRDLLSWVNSLDIMRDLNAEFLVPSHTRPLVGRAAISQLFLVYRDAIQFVHDQTVRFMNKGLSPDEIVERIQLPKTLLENPYLQPFYGTLPWSIRGVFNGYMGWFSGVPADLSPLGPSARAQRLVSLGGGTEKVLSTAASALGNSDWQWALELASAVVTLQPNYMKARELKIESLKMAASVQSSSCGRNYYLTSALEEARHIDLKPDKQRVTSVIMTSSVAELLDRMSRRLKAEDCSDVNTKVEFIFTDVNTNVCVHIRHGIADVKMRKCVTPDNLVTTTRDVWFKLVANQISPLKAYANSDVVIKGSVLAFREFTNCFEKN